MIKVVKLPDEDFLKICESFYGTMILKVPKLGRKTVEAKYEVALAMVLRLARPFYQKERIGAQVKIGKEGRLYCSRCKKTLQTGFIYCPNCGRKLVSEDYTDANFWAFVTKVNADVIAEMLGYDTEELEKIEPTSKNSKRYQNNEEEETDLDEENELIDDAAALEIMDDIQSEKDLKPKPKTKKKGGHSANGRA